ncbi:hypothetical protein D3C87_1791390 [compost metagenome]
MMRSQSVGSNSKNLPKAAIPALLIKISIVLNSDKAFSTAAFTELISATSAAIASAFTLKERAFAATLSISSCVLAIKITFTPSFAKAMATALPIPFPAPVIRAFLFFKSFIFY